MYAPSVEVKKDDYLKEICSPGSYGLFPGRMQLDRAIHCSSFSCVHWRSYYETHNFTVGVHIIILQFVAAILKHLKQTFGYCISKKNCHLVKIKLQKNTQLAQLSLRAHCNAQSNLKCCISAKRLCPRASAVKTLLFI